MLNHPCILEVNSMWLWKRKRNWWKNVLWWRSFLRNRIQTLSCWMFAGTVVTDTGVRTLAMPLFRASINHSSIQERGLGAVQRRQLLKAVWWFCRVFSFFVILDGAFCKYIIMLITCPHQSDWGAKRYTCVTRMDHPLLALGSGSPLLGQ